MVKENNLNKTYKRHMRGNGDDSLDVKIARLEEQFIGLNDNVIKGMTELNQKLDKASSVFDKYVEKGEYAELREELRPVVKWVNDRIAIERVIYGVLAYLGISNLITIVIIVTKLL